MRAETLQRLGIPTSGSSSDGAPEASPALRSGGARQSRRARLSDVSRRLGGILRAASPLPGLSGSAHAQICVSDEGYDTTVAGGCTSREERSSTRVLGRRGWGLSPWFRYRMLVAPPAQPKHAAATG